MLPPLLCQALPGALCSNSKSLHLMSLCGVRRVLLVGNALGCPTGPRTHSLALMRMAWAALVLAGWHPQRTVRGRGVGTRRGSLVIYSDLLVSAVTAITACTFSFFL